MRQKLQKNSEWIDEYHNGVRYGLQGHVLVDEKTKYQRITIVESRRYGKALLLDGCWMTAEHQEKHYHESLVHPALCSAAQLERVLVIGGGDGGTARECLRHKNLKLLDMVEIDSKVVELSQKYLPSLGGNAWQDPRLQLSFENGISWVEKAKPSSYDAILIDSSDPIGPAKELFHKTFLEKCKRILRKEGVFATQSESPESFQEVHIKTIKLIREVFGYAHPLYGWVPLYPSGWWSWTFASLEGPRYLKPIKARASSISQECEIWSEKWQEGAFRAMPAFIERELNQ